MHESGRSGRHVELSSTLVPGSCISSFSSCTSYGSSYTSLAIGYTSVVGQQVYPLMVRMPASSRKIYGI